MKEEGKKTINENEAMLIWVLIYKNKFANQDEHTNAHLTEIQIYIYRRCRHIENHGYKHIDEFRCRQW